jgi:hypothetical protein
MENTVCKFIPGSYKMSRVAVSMDWVKCLIHILKTVKYNIEGVEINTFDVDKATILLNSINNIQNVVTSLEKIQNNPDRYSCSNN